MPSSEPSPFRAELHVDAVLSTSFTGVSANGHHVVLWTVAWTYREGGRTGTLRSTNFDDLMQHGVDEALRPADDDMIVVVHWTVNDGYSNHHDVSTEDLLDEEGGRIALPGAVWRGMLCMCHKHLFERHPHLQV